MRQALGALALILAVAIGAAAAAPPSFKMGPPEMAAAVPLVTPALDKPALAVSSTSLPPSPEPIPSLPRTRVESDLGQQPVAPAPAPRWKLARPHSTSSRKRAPPWRPRSSAATTRACSARRATGWARR